MFVRVRKQPGKEGPIPYAYLVENHWNPFRKKHEQKILMPLGRLSALPADGTVEKIITALDTFATRMGFSAISDGVILNNLSADTTLTKTYEYGSLLLTSHVLKQLSFFEVFDKIWEGASRRLIGKDAFLAACLGLIAARMQPFVPMSERRTHSWYTNEVYHPLKVPLLLDDWYRSLDVLIAQKDQIEKAYYEKNKTLFNGELDIVLFDTTSVYYYGKQNPERVYRDTDLLQYGFSKDGKGDLKQLIVGVLMTREGVPIAHEVFRGNTADVVSFAEIIHVLKEKYQIGKVILIADRGMVSEDNLRLLETEKLSYLLGVRMRKLSPTLREKLLVGMEGAPKDTSEMEFVADNLYTHEFPLSKLTKEEIGELLNQRAKSIQKRMQKKKSLDSPLKEECPAGPVFNHDAYSGDLVRRKYFVCLNPYVQKANKKKRAYFKKVIEQKIQTKTTKDWIVKNGYKKYIEFEDKVTLKLNEEKLKDEEFYDGKWVIVTNDESITPGLAGIYYKSLQFVERGFHDLKSLITVRPIFHFKEERIRAHIFVCFLALIVKWYICKTINRKGQEDGRRFIEEMLKLKAIEVDPAIPLYIRTTIAPGIQEQMKKLGMKIPGKVIQDARVKPIKPNPKGGRPRKTDPNQFQLPFLTALKKKEA